MAGNRSAVKQHPLTEKPGRGRAAAILTPHELGPVRHTSPHPAAQHHRLVSGGLQQLGEQRDVRVPRPEHDTAPPARTPKVGSPAAVRGTGAARGARVRVAAVDEVGCWPGLNPRRRGRHQPSHRDTDLRRGHPPREPFHLARGQPVQRRQVGPLVGVRLQGRQIEEHRRSVPARSALQRRRDQVPDPTRRRKHVLGREQPVLARG
jgi:hypothetical protein